MDFKSLSPAQLKKLNEENDAKVLELINQGSKKTVWFLGYSMNYDGDEHHGIFSSKENAEKYRDFMIENGGSVDNEFVDWHYYISEYVIDGPLQDCE